MSLNISYNDSVTENQLKTLDDANLLIFAQQRDVVRVESFELCFNGLRYANLTRFPVSFSSDLRYQIIQKVLEKQRTF
jgi:hypothetical protein